MRSSTNCKTARNPCETAFGPISGRTRRTRTHYFRYTADECEPPEIRERSRTLWVSVGGCVFVRHSVVNLNRFSYNADKPSWFIFWIGVQYPSLTGYGNGNCLLNYFVNIFCEQTSLFTLFHGQLPVAASRTKDERWEEIHLVLAHYHCNRICAVMPCTLHCNCILSPNGITWIPFETIRLDDMESLGSKIERYVR